MGRRLALSRDQRAEFKLCLRGAKEAGFETFWFENQEILVSYGEYMVEYWGSVEQEFKEETSKRMSRLKREMNHHEDY